MRADIGACAEEAREAFSPESPGETGGGAPWGGVREGAVGSVRPVDEHMHLMTLCSISVVRHTAPGDNYEAGGRPFRSLMC